MERVRLASDRLPAASGMVGSGGSSLLRVAWVRLSVPVPRVARASSPLMQQGPSDELHRKGHVVRIQIELEQGEP